jgi:hypothetical protein
MKGNVFIHCPMLKSIRWPEIFAPDMLLRIIQTWRYVVVNEKREKKTTLQAFKSSDSGMQGFS